MFKKFFIFFIKACCVCNIRKDINFAQVKLGFAEDVFSIFAKDKLPIVSGYIVYIYIKQNHPEHKHTKPLTLNGLGEGVPPPPLHLLRHHSDTLLIFYIERLYA